jgi:hypothetical protein
LKITQKNIYDKINDLYLDNNYLFHNYLYHNTLKYALLYQYSFLYLNTRRLSFPISGSINELNKISFPIFNYIYFFRYLKSKFNIPANKKNEKTFAEIIRQGGQFFNLIKKNNSLIWESNGFLIMYISSSKNKLTLTSYTTDLSLKNNLSNVKNNVNLFDIIIKTKYIKFKKIQFISTNLLVQNKNIGDIKIKFVNNIHLAIFINNNLLYNIVCHNDYFCLYRLCVEDMNPICIIKFFPNNNNNNNNNNNDGNNIILTFETMYSIIPLELIIGFICGSIIADKNNIGNFIKNATNHIMESVNCDFQEYLEQITSF